jgi:flagellar basal body P-ring formation protein FlgA
MTLFAPILLVAAVFAGAAAEAQVLRPRATVDGDVVRLGDLFASLPAEAAARAIAPAPAPGRTALFDAASLVQLARENGLNWAPQSRFDRAMVQRASRTVDAEDIEAGILAALRAEGLEDGMQIDLLNKKLALHAATGNGRAFEIRGVRYDRRDKSFVATLAVDAGAEGIVPVEVRGTVFRTMRVPVLSRAMRNGQVIGEDDVVWKGVREGALDTNLLTEVEALIGKTPRTTVRPGEMLRRTEVMAPIVIAKGELVTMVVSTPMMTLTAQGKATENGTEGQAIKIENTRSKTVVEGVVAGPNRVIVTRPGLAALTK